MLTSSRFNPIISPNFTLHGKIPLLFLDGGMGTTLEDVFKKDVSHPLWSAKFIEKDEKTITAIHSAFLEAGSDIILTSTYQLTYETAAKAGYSNAEAELLMQKSIKLAREISQDQGNGRNALKTGSLRPRNPLVALSLGPYGATLETAAEFTGIYPPPYGPCVASGSDSNDSASCRPQRGPFPFSEEASYIQALASFHFSRLLAYAKHRRTWDSIDLIAFETVPLLMEAKAIRIAIARMQEWLKETSGEQDKLDPALYMKPWYISFVFPGPNGEFIENRLVGNSTLKDHLDRGKRPYTPFEVAQAAFSLENESHLGKMAVPDGIGINCTDVSTLDSIVKGFALGVKSLSTLVIGYRPWLALYPNGGVTYDAIAKQWAEDGRSAPRKDAWAKSVSALLSEEIEEYYHSFDGLMVGGCCKTEPRDIEMLQQELLRTGNLIKYGDKVDTTLY